MSKLRKSLNAAASARHGDVVRSFRANRYAGSRVLLEPNVHHYADNADEKKSNGLVPIVNVEAKKSDNE
jgi:hypothetical protein